MTTKISLVAIDLAKGSFQVCAVGSDGAVLCNRALSRTRLAALLADQPSCIVAMEACATSHHWGRVAQRYGHEVRLVPAAYVKPFVKRQKNDRADAEAIAEAALRPTMRFVAVKSAETQGRAVAFRTHQCLVRQRTQLINALRGHLAEFGVVAPKGPASLKLLENALADEASDLPDPVREMGAIYTEQIARLTEVIEQLAQFRGSARSPLVPWRRLHQTSTLSTAGVTSRPGSGWSHGNGPPAARPGSGRSAKWARLIFVGS
jgi:transposase